MLILLPSSCGVFCNSFLYNLKISCETPFKVSATILFSNSYLEVFSQSQVSFLWQFPIQCGVITARDEEVLMIMECPLQETLQQQMGSLHLCERRAVNNYILYKINVINIKVTWTYTSSACSQNRLLFRCEGKYPCTNSTSSMYYVNTTFMSFLNKAIL